MESTKKGAATGKGDLPTRSPGARRSVAAGLDNPVVAVEKLIAGLGELTPDAQAKAAIARVLAVRLLESEPAAAAAVAKELRSVLDDILDAASEQDEFVRGLFAGVRDQAEPE
jgi:hypothetical protein